METRPFKKIFPSAQDYVKMQSLKFHFNGVRYEYLYLYLSAQRSYDGFVVSIEYIHRHFRNLIRQHLLAPQSLPADHQSEAGPDWDDRLIKVFVSFKKNLQVLAGNLKSTSLSSFC